MTGVRDKKTGFSLQEVSHDGHAFAEAISLERIAVASFSDLDWKRPRSSSTNYHIFGLGDCKQIEAPTISVLPTGTTDPLGYYAPRVKLSAKYEKTDLLGEKGQSIVLELAYLLTAYGKDPSHEPGGVISAARIYPTLTFTVPSLTRSKQNPRFRHPTAVQALLRVNLTLDDQGVGNQCGIFTDPEELGALGVSLSALWGPHLPGSFNFLRAEKPLTWEVVGRAVRHGSHIGWTSDEPGWDNIHQWSHPTIPYGPHPKEGFDNQPYTPGLPYGGHLHWRWGRTATGTKTLPGGKQYAGAGGPGKPLIDSRIYNQNIEFAIVDGSTRFGRSDEDLLGRLDRDPVSYLFRDFSLVWEDVRIEPQLLMPSANILIWVSQTAWGPGWNGTSLEYREFHPGSGISPKDFPNVPHDVQFVLPEWGGTLFPQGLFFPHDDAGILPQKLRLIPGVHKAQFLPTAPDRVWRRD